MSRSFLFNCGKQSTVKCAFATDIFIEISHLPLCSEKKNYLNSFYDFNCTTLANNVIKMETFFEMKKKYVIFNGLYYIIILCFLCGFKYFFLLNNYHPKQTI